MGSCASTTASQSALASVAPPLNGEKPGKIEEKAVAYTAPTDTTISPAPAPIPKPAAEPCLPPQSSIAVDNAAKTNGGSTTTIDVRPNSFEEQRPAAGHTDKPIVPPTLDVGAVGPSPQALRKEDDISPMSTEVVKPTILHHGQLPPASPRGAAADSSARAAPSVEIIVDWPMAVEQCGGDEDFLRELLVDLWTESIGHLELLMDSVPARRFDVTRNIAHTIKGAAANLMCYGLRDAALLIERTAMRASTLSSEGTNPNAPPSAEKEALSRAIDTGLEALQAEVLKFKKYLQMKDLI